jgi:hypothetical protein
MTTFTTASGFRLLNGATYNLGATSGRYDAASDSFILGNCSISRGETIYADKADPVFMREVRESEVAETLKDAGLDARPLNDRMSEARARIEQLESEESTLRADLDIVTDALAFNRRELAEMLEEREGVAVIHTPRL